MALEGRTKIRKLYLDNFLLGLNSQRKFESTGMAGLLKVAYGLIIAFMFLILLACVEFLVFFFTGPDTPFQFIVAWQLVISTFLFFAGVGLYVAIDLGGLRP